MHRPYVGIDIIEIDRIRKSIGRFGDRFLRRVYTERELAIYRNQPHSLAARFAAKEATIKTLVTRKVSWVEIEILPYTQGKPCVHLSGKARTTARELGLGEIAVSLSHCREYATACAVAVVSE